MLGAEVWAPASQPLAVLFWSQFWLRKMANKYLLNCGAQCFICTALISSPRQPCKESLALFCRWGNRPSHGTALAPAQGLGFPSQQLWVERETSLLYEKPRDETPRGVRYLLSGPWALPAATQTGLVRMEWNPSSTHGSSMPRCTWSAPEGKRTQSSVPGQVAQSM